MHLTTEPACIIMLAHYIACPNMCMPTAQSTMHRDNCVARASAAFFHLAKHLACTAYLHARTIGHPCILTINCVAAGSLENATDLYTHQLPCTNRNFSRKKSRQERGLRGNSAHTRMHQKFCKVRKPPKHTHNYSQNTMAPAPHTDTPPPGHINSP